MQPWRGLFGLAVCFMIAIGIASAFPSAEAFLGLMMCWAIACVAPECVMGLLWGGIWPAERLENPWRGIGLTVLMLILGSLAVWLTMQFVGAGEITPLLKHYLIMTVVIALWLIVAFQGWPFMGRVSLPAAGFIILTITYLLDLAIFRLWDFNAAPYFFGDTSLASVTPRGPFHPDSAVTFGVMTVFFLFVFVLMDMWPLSKSPSLAKQPVMGVTLLAVCVGLSVASWAIMRWALDMLPYEILIKLPVCGLFGCFIILPMLQTWPGRRWAQPTKGIVNLVLVAVLGVVMFFAVRALGSMFTGLAFETPDIYPTDYEWMATFMLGLAFPAMFIYGPFFDFWPLPPTPSPPGSSESGAG